MKSLYYTKGMAATPEEKAEAEGLGITAFRNAEYVRPGDRLERCDQVAGAVPAGYAKLGIKIVGTDARKLQAADEDEDDADDKGEGADPAKKGKKGGR